MSEKESRIPEEFKNDFEQMINDAKNSTTTQAILDKGKGVLDDIKSGEFFDKTGAAINEVYNNLKDSEIVQDAKEKVGEFVDNVKSGKTVEDVKNFVDENVEKVKNSDVYGKILDGADAAVDKAKDIITDLKEKRN